MLQHVSLCEKEDGDRRGSYHALLLLQVDVGESVLDEASGQSKIELLAELAEDKLALGGDVRGFELTRKNVSKSVRMSAWGATHNSSPNMNTPLVFSPGARIAFHVPSSESL